MDQNKLLQCLLDQLSRHSIGSLTINNYGSLTVLGDAPRPEALQVPSSRQGSGDVKLMWGWQSAHIKIKNSLGGPVYRFKLTHQRSVSDPVYQSKEWYNVGQGATTDSWATDYQAGFMSDFDLWYCEVQPAENGPVFRYWQREVSQYRQCNLRDEDKWENGDLTFELTGNVLKMNLRSGGDELEFSKSNEDYNAFAFLEVENQFGVAMSEVAVKHRFGDKSYTHSWSETVQPGSKTSPWPVYYETGVFIGDIWNISVMRNGDKNPHVNSKKDKGCWLQSDDKGRACQLIVKDGGWTMNFPSGNCNDDWDWQSSEVAVRKESKRSSADEDDADWTRDL